MKYFISIFNSDSVNKNLQRFPASELVSMLSQKYLTGVPTCVGHDLHRILGWSRPIGLHFEPGLTRLFGLITIAENEEEISKIEATLNDHLKHRILEETKNTIGKLRNLIKIHLKGDEYPLSPNCTALFGPGLAQRVFKKIFAKVDNDGLIPWQDLEHVGYGCFRVGDLIAFAHPFFRRSLSRYNNLNVEFFTAFDEICSGKSLNPRIAIDPDMVGFAEDLKKPIELEYIWGPKFSNDLKSMPTGVTVHESNSFDRNFNGIKRMEFIWGRQNDIHTFECEELVEIPVGGQKDLYGCRYVHSLVDENSGTIQHLDGAIRAYPDNQFEKRLLLDIKKAGRRSKYTKLWRVDGSIPLSGWKRLIASYFRNNKLVCEYFGNLEEEKKSDPRNTNQDEAPKDILSRLVPFSIGPDDGIRLTLSFLPLSTENTALPERVVIPIPNQMVGPTEREALPFIEADGIELAKVLKRKKLECHLPPEWLRVAFEDMYTQLPWIRHRGVVFRINPA